MKSVVLGIVCFLVVLAGCSRGSREMAIERAIEKETGVKADVDISDDGMKIKTKDGEVTITGGKAAKLPSDFPSDVYIYKGATVTTVMKLGAGSSVTLASSDDPSSVAKAYSKEMTARGWKTGASMDMGGQRMMMFSKGKRMVTLTAGENDGATVIGLTVASQ